MNDNATAVSVSILGKEYPIACSPNEKDELLASARYLDQKMREIRDQGRIAGLDKIAIMAALNIAHERTQVQLENSSSSEGFCERLKGLGKKIDALMQRIDFS